MKIAIINTADAAPLTARARDFFPDLVRGLAGNGIEVHVLTDAATEPSVAETKESGVVVHAHAPAPDGAPEKTAADLTVRLNALNPDVYLIWASGDAGWMALPFLNPQIATLAVGHEDSEVYYAPARHYRAFLTRVIATTPEIAVGFVLSCVIDKERVEWISFDEGEATEAENDRELTETYRACCEKAVADAQAAPRETAADFPPIKTPARAPQSWFEKLKSKLTG